MSRTDTEGESEGDATPRVAHRRLRILLLIKCLGYGGAERLLVDMVRHRGRDRYDYEVAYILENEDSLVPDIVDAGVPVHSLGAGSNRDLAWMVRLYSLLRQGNFDVMHSHLPYAVGLGRVVAVAGRTPARRPALVTTEHSLWNKMEIGIKLVNRCTAGFDDRLLVVSEAAKDSLPPSLRQRATVVIHGVEMESVTATLAQRETIRLEVRQEFGLAEGELLALTVANLRVEKGHDVLLRAARQVIDEGAPVRFVVAGRGPLEGELEDERVRLRLSDRYHFAGQRSDVLRLLAAADLFVLPSRHEGLPVVLMEAAATGVPIVATAVGEIPNLWTNGLDAVLVPPEDPQALAEGILTVVRDEALRQRLAIGSLARGALFDVTRCVGEIEAIYDELAARPRDGTYAP